MNFKGGVGKTTDTVNISSILAGHEFFPATRVLVVDLDPQCNTSFLMLGRERWRAADSQRLTTERLFREHMSGNNPGGVAPMLVQSVRDDLPHGRALDIIPCSMETIHRASDCQLMEHPRYRQILSNALAPLLESYEFILVDCGPSYNLLTENALVAAEFQIIPYTPDYLALEEIKWLGRLTTRFERMMRGRPVARPLGVIVNAYSQINAAHNAIGDLFEVMRVMKEQELLPAFATVYRPFVRRAARVAEAALAQRALLDFAPNHPVTQDFVELTQEITRHIAAV